MHHLSPNPHSNRLSQEELSTQLLKAIRVPMIFIHIFQSVISFKEVFFQIIVKNLTTNASVSFLLT